MKTIEKAETYIAPTYNRPDILFVRGEGSYLYDDQDTAYLDMTSGVAVNALGHGSSVIQAAIQDASKGLIHTSNLFHTEAAAHLAELLCKNSFADRVFFCNSGAESVEGALKFARLCGGKERRHIIYFDHSFHGRTMGALSATDRPLAREPFTPLPEKFEKAVFNDESVFSQLGDHTAAVIVEPIQGEGGVRPANKMWLKKLRQHCTETGTLLIFDEVQSGLGRTGKLFAYEHFDVTPDILTLAKPLAGGLPMGAVLMSERVSKHITPGCHATTFGGGPFVASVACRVLETVNDAVFLENVARKGALLKSALDSLDNVLDVTGAGLLIGARLAVDAKEVVEESRKEGLLVVPAAGNVVRFLPPLTVGDEIEEVVQRFSVSLDKVVKRVN